MNKAAPIVTTKGKEQKQTGTLRLLRVGPIPGRLHMSGVLPAAGRSQGLSRATSSPAFLPLPWPALTASLCRSVPCWKQLGTSGQSPSVSSHPLDHRFRIFLFGFKFQVQPPRQVSQCVTPALWPLAPSSQAALWLQGLRNHTLPEAISHSILFVSLR